MCHVVPWQLRQGDWRWQVNFMDAKSGTERHRTQFILNSTSDDTRPYLGIRIWFPYVPDQLDSVAVHNLHGAPNTNLHFIIKLYY